MTSQRKGEYTAAQNERECPYIVEVPVPQNGLGATLLAMHEFHHDRKLEHRRGRGQHRDGRDYVRWCFAHIADADAFQKAFGAN
jgi:hypothetical protein